MSQLEFDFMQSKPARVIGLAGTRGSGKDWIGRKLQELDSNVVLLAFADDLKKEIAEAIGHPLDYVESHKEEFRPLLQVWGTEYRRDFCLESYWLDKMSERLKGVPSGATVVITDVRFNNEVDFIHSLGGQVLRISRAGVIRELEDVDFHRSEKAIETLPTDGTVINDPDQPQVLEQVLNNILNECPVTEPTTIPMQLA